MDRGLRGVVEGKSSLRVQVPVESKSAQSGGGQPLRGGDPLYQATAAA